MQRSAEPPKALLCIVMPLCVPPLGQSKRMSKGAHRAGRLSERRVVLYFANACSCPMRTCACLILMLLTALPAAGQRNRLLHVHDPSYEYIVRLQRRGYLLELNPTATPYRHGAVAAAIASVDTTRLSPSEGHWLRLVRYAVRQVPRDAGEAAVGYYFDGQASLVNSDRKELLRPRGDTLNFFYEGTAVSGWAEFGSLVTDFSIWHSRYYEDDPDGLDVALRLYARSENTYVGYHRHWLSAYVGRWNQHWGVPGEAATVLSNNPRSQDQLYLKLGGGRLSVTGVLSELDSATDGLYFTGRAEDDSVRAGSTRRYFAAHRWDFRPGRRFMVSFMESAIYSGPGSSLSLKYLNPMHVFSFVVDNRPKNDENNGFLAGLLWAQISRLTIHGQFMVDDINLQGIGRESMTFAMVGSAVVALPKLDVGIALEAVSARAYNAPQPEGRYLYLQRGLATQFSDYVSSTLWADVYLDTVPGLRLKPHVAILYQGERDIRQPFPSNDELLDNILDGQVARTVRTAAEIMYQPVPWAWARAEGGFNSTDGNTRFAGSLSVGLRFTLQAALPLAL